MILRDRLFVRNPPDREAKSIYIFCEGKKREFQYFSFFKNIDSRVNVVVHELDSSDNNSPLGLIKIAKDILKPLSKNSILQKNDEVWLVIDSDPDQSNSRKKQIEKVKIDCANYTRWFTAESNPCFEVWLYYHVKDQPLDSEDMQTCSPWKRMMNELIGGFNSSKHPSLIIDARENSKKNYKCDDSDRPHTSSTQLFRLADTLLSLMEEKIKKAQLILDSL